METPAWILVFILSGMLFLFLLLFIILLIKLIGVTKEAKKIMIQGQGIAEKADDIAGNVRDMTTVGGLVRYFVDNYTGVGVRKKKAKKAKIVKNEEEKEDEQRK
ncbi:MAG: hypothetical protein K5837_00930 [Candidatus Saccharibacteria bacterium]|nr:hypothetical protein [Candidatus Saccharibacteria bacterium]